MTKQATTEAGSITGAASELSAGLGDALRQERDTAVQKHFAISQSLQREEVERRENSLLVKIDQLETALAALLSFHDEGDDGEAIPREYWSPEYLAAVENAEALLKPNV